MKLSKLRDLAREAREHPTYQFYALSDDELFAMATKSFQRLPEKQQDQVKRSWEETLQAAGETLTEVTGKELLIDRFLAQTNLFFLCNLLEKYNQVTLGTHGDICNEFF